MTGITARFPTRWTALASSLTILCTVAIGAGAQTAPPHFTKDDPGEHYRYFYRQRANPNGEIPRGALARARRQMAAQWPARGLLQGQAVGNGWTSIGPFNIPGQSIASTGRLTTIAVHPTVVGTIYVGGAQGGVWKTVNGGANWTPLTDDMCSLAMGSIVIDQVDPNIVYAGTGELHNSGDSYYGCGVLRTADGGANWTQLGASVFDVTGTFTGGASIAKLLIKRSTAGSLSTTTLFAATTIGLFKSTNSGTSWTQMTNGLPTARMSDIVADSLTPGTFYAAVGRQASGNNNNGVYKTTDDGVTWIKQTTLPSTNVGRINLAISQSSPNVLYASIENKASGSLLGIFKTIDGGANWTQLAPSVTSCNSQCWYDMHIEVDLADPNVVYFGGFELYKSTNGGVSFTNISGSPRIHVDQHAFAFDPVNSSTIYAGNDGGIYKSVNGGSTWTTLNTDIVLNQFYPGFSLHPTNPNNALGGSQDNGTNEYNGAPGWNAVNFGDGGYTAIDHVTGNVAWSENQWDETNTSFNGPYRRDSPTGGFAQKRTGLVLTDRAEFIPPFVMDPVNPKVLYFGTFRLFRTRDNGENWTAISGDLTSGGSETVTAIAVARSDTNTIYVGTSDGRVQASGNAGQSFVLGAGLPGRFVTDLAVDPTNAAIAYAAVSSFGIGHVWRTADRGVTWQNISGNLPDVPVNAIVIQPGVEIDIGTDLGVFKSTDGGTTWNPFLGLPNVAIYDLVFNPTTQLLVAATHGRGAFKFTVSTVLALRGDATADNVVSALDAQAVLSATVGLQLPPTWKPAAPNGDANCDGTAPTAADAQIILSFVVGLPVGGFCVGKFQ